MSTETDIAGVHIFNSVRTDSYKEIKRGSPQLLRELRVVALLYSQVQAAAHYGGFNIEAFFLDL